jgi:hypothetical protein
MKKLNFIWIFLALFLGSCANIYFAPNSVSLSKEHTKIAILPPKVSVVERQSLIKEEADKEEVLKQLSMTIQNDTYSWMQKRNSNRNKHKIEILDIDVTNQKLKSIKPDITNQELCKILKVDAILISKYSFEKKFSDGVSNIAYYLLLPTGLSFLAFNKHCQVNCSLYYCSKEKNGWTYDYMTDGIGVSSYSGLGNSLMKHFSKKTPYTKGRD